MTSRRRIRTAMPVAVLGSQTNMSPSRMTVPRSSATASSVPLAVFFRKRFFCASHWSSSSISMLTSDSRFAHSRSLILPRTVSMMTMGFLLAEDIFLIERNRLQRLDRGMHSIDGDSERFRVHLDIWSAGVADHITLANFPDILDGHHLSLEPETFLDSTGMRCA